MDLHGACCSSPSIDLFCVSVLCIMCMLQMQSLQQSFALVKRTILTKLVEGLLRTAWPGSIAGIGYQT